MVGLSLESSGSHFGVILGSILAHVGTIWGALGGLWATLDPLGASWEKKPDLGHPFGPFWGHF